MKIEDHNQNDNQQKSLDSSEDQQKEGKKSLRLLDKLIFTIVISTVGYVGLTFINCNFMIPGSIESANAQGKLKNPPSMECSQSLSQGYNALFTLFTALLGLKAKMDD